MVNWEKRLKHDRVVRDALVDCGNKKPDRPDPPGGLIEVQPLVYNSEIFWKHLTENGHDGYCFVDCSCSREERNEDHDH